MPDSEGHPTVLEILKIAMDEAAEKQRKVRDQVEALDKAVSGDPRFHVANIAKEAAKLQAYSQESSSASATVAARIVSDALDRNTEASNQSHTATIWWQRIAVGVSAVIVFVMFATSPWCAPAPEPTIAQPPTEISAGETAAP